MERIRPTPILGKDRGPDDIGSRKKGGIGGVLKNREAAIAIVTVLNKCNMRAKNRGWVKKKSGSVKM